MEYAVNNGLTIDAGFTVEAAQVEQAMQLANQLLWDIPDHVYARLNLKIIGAAAGQFFASSLVSIVPGCMVNPIEGGHPDLLPIEATGSSYETFLHYPIGLEVKGTVGWTRPRLNLPVGQERIWHLGALKWSAHHTRSTHTVAFVWDFCESRPTFTAAFYAELNPAAWSKHVGFKNTSVTQVNGNGKRRLAVGWLVLPKEPAKSLRLLQLLRGRDPAQTELATVANVVV